MSSSRSITGDAAVISALTALSRVSGLARVLVVGAVLGRGSLGDLYQTANSVPNLVFELLAGGALQAALVPRFVAADRDDPERGLGRAAAAVTRSMLRGAGVVVVVGLVLTPVVVRLLTLAEPDDAVAGNKWRLGTWMLWLFLPQLLWYAMGAVSSAVLAARRRFAAAAVAPLVNNLVVIGAYLWFDHLRGDRGPGLDLRPIELIVLAGGTTLGVVAFTSVPLLAARRAGVKLWGEPVGTSPFSSGLGRTGGWATVHVAATLAPQLGVLIAGNGADGGVALFSWGLTFFLLPSSLVALPVAIAVAPRAAAAHQLGDRGALAAAVRGAARTVLPAAIVAAVGLGLLAWPLVRLLPLGELQTGGLGPVAHTLQAFAPGIVGYSAWALGSRVLFSTDRTRSAALSTGVGALVALVAMVIGSEVVSADERAAALAGAYGAGFVVAGLLVWRSVAAVVAQPGAVAT